MMSLFVLLSFRSLDRSVFRNYINYSIKLYKTLDSSENLFVLINKCFLEGNSSVVTPAVHFLVRMRLLKRLAVNGMLSISTTQRLNKLI